MISSRARFEQAYAARSGVTVAVLHALGRRAAPCGCGDAHCEGWQMAYAEAADARMGCLPTGHDFPDGAQACGRCGARREIFGRGTPAGGGD